MSHYITPLKHYLLAIIAIATTVVLTSCSSTKTIDPTSAIDEIEQLINNGKFDQARQMADEISADTTLALTNKQLCRMSIIYMKISDAIDTDINTTIATRYYRRAINNNADSASTFYGALPLEESRHVDLMSKLEPMLSADRDNYLDEDSIATPMLDEHFEPLFEPEPNE